MPMITGTTGNDTLTILTDTSSVQASAGTDTAVFTGDYANCTFQSDSYVSTIQERLIVALNNDIHLFK